MYKSFCYTSPIGHTYVLAFDLADDAICTTIQNLIPLPEGIISFHFHVFLDKERTRHLTRRTLNTFLSISSI